METKKKTLEIGSVAKLAITVSISVAGRISVRLDRSKDIDNFGICRPGVIIRKDGEFYLTIGGYANLDRVSIELVSLSKNEVSSLDIDLDSTQIKVSRYCTNEDEEREIVDALRCKVWNRMYHVVRKLFDKKCFYNDLFTIIGLKRSRSFVMVPLPEDKIWKVFSNMNHDSLNSHLQLHNNRKNLHIYWYVKDYYERFITKKEAANNHNSNSTPVCIVND